MIPPTYDVLFAANAAREIAQLEALVALIQSRLAELGYDVVKADIGLGFEAGPPADAIG